MPPPVAVVLSYRLGGSDGVSIESAKWATALACLGFDVRRIAGEILGTAQPGDTQLSFLAIGGEAPTPGDRVRLQAELQGVDLVVVENLCSLPMNLPAALTAAEVLSDHDGRVAFHHHDLPWERRDYAHVAELPVRLDGALHIAITDHARGELDRRGFRATTVRNTFAVDATEGDRRGTRQKLPVGPDDLVVLQPTRAIPRKRVDVGLALAEQLGERLAPRRACWWLTGPAEDGFGPRLDAILRGARIPVVHGPTPEIGDAYAAADLVVVSSAWEGFGNAVVEAAIAWRPVAATHYPVLSELQQLGLEVLPAEDVGAVATWLRDPDPAVLDHNRDVARRELSVTDLPARIRRAFAGVGWDRW